MHTDSLSLSVCLSCLTYFASKAPTLSLSNKIEVKFNLPLARFRSRGLLGLLDLLSNPERPFLAVSFVNWDTRTVLTHVPPPWSKYPETVIADGTLVCPRKICLSSITFSCAVEFTCTHPKRTKAQHSPKVIKFLFVKQMISKIFHNMQQEFRQLEESNVAFLHKIIKSGAVWVIFSAPQFC